MADPHAAYIELPPPPLPAPAALHSPSPAPWCSVGGISAPIVCDSPAPRRLPVRSTPSPCPLNFTMSGMSSDDASAEVRLEGEVSGEKVQETQDQNEGSGMPSPQEEVLSFPGTIFLGVILASWVYIIHVIFVPSLYGYSQEAAIKKKYGGKIPKKSPLISKDHERAFFDSADWALGKQGGNPNKPKGPLEALRPKLQPTQQNARARRSSYASADNDESLSLPAEELIQNDDPTEDKNKE
ncbi:uncharacterized protein LOC119268580 isoform X1 [Triticum dicoccoides]|nr:uncharacterized protein LOC119268580 isoform X1 [Triticum dicoccoides]